MLPHEKNTLIRDIKSEFSKIMPIHSLPHFLTIDPHAQSVYMGMLQIHCTMGYHYMALLHTEVLLEFHIVSHATATPLNHLLSLFAEHIDISDGRYCQVCKWRTNLRRCSACSWCYYCSHTCQLSDWKSHKRTLCTKLIGPQPQDWGTARELEIMAQRRGFGGWRPEAVLLCTGVLSDHQAREWWLIQHIDRGGDVLLTDMMAIAHEKGLLYAFIASRNKFTCDRTIPPTIWYKPDPGRNNAYQKNTTHTITPQCIIHTSTNRIQSFCELQPTHRKGMRDRCPKGAM